MILFHNFMTQCKSVMDSFVLRHDENKIKNRKGEKLYLYTGVFTSEAGIQRRVATRNKFSFVVFTF